MNRKQKIQRITLLFNCLQYSTDVDQSLKPGERIVINQEIGNLLHLLEYPSASYKPIPASIEVKITETQKQIIKRDWSSINEFPFEISDY